MNKYIPLHLHSHFSLLDGLSQPKHIINRLDELELDGCAITDHGNLGCTVELNKALKEQQKKSILGCELYLSNGPCTQRSSDNRKLFHQVVLAKNHQGWKNLIKITSDSNAPERFYHRPRVDFKYLEEHSTDGLVTFSGHLGSHLANVALQDNLTATVKQAEYLRDLFGKDNFFLEIQLIDAHNNVEAQRVADILREVGKITGIPCVATADSHYCRKQDAEDQRILLCANLGTTLGNIQKAVDNDEEVGLGCFFKSDCFHIPSFEEMTRIHTEEELNNTLLIAHMCEDYNILGRPIVPPFECPDGLTPAEYLRVLCRKGWATKIENKIDAEQRQEYIDRVKYELDVLQGANLSSYFLIVEDIIRYAKSNNWLVGPGRGSAAGCLVSYLIGITAIDPIEYDLIFERFYNPGRNTATHVSFPDIDIDVPVNKREQIIQYAKDKYGHDRVSQMATYQTMKGRGAMKAVLRAHGGTSFYEMDRITEFIPDEARIAADLQEMLEETGEASIIRWALENDGKHFEEWCYLDAEDKLQGPLSKRFEQAIRLEGTKIAQSKHASGIVIAPEPLSKICPMILDNKSKDKSLIAGLHMNALADLGILKLDVLGLNYLDKIDGIRQILEVGDIYE
jgi:DNA polymerase-3 subunit alpha